MDLQERVVPLIFIFELYYVGVQKLTQRVQKNHLGVQKIS